MRSIFTPVLVLSTLLAGCEPQTSDAGLAVSAAEVCLDPDAAEDLAASVQPGLVVGMVTSPSGTVPIAGAIVTVVVDGEEQTTFSGAQGCFSVSLDGGEYELTVEKGRYTAAATVPVAASTITDLGALPIDPGDLKVAVTFGDYDDVGSLLGALGIEFDAYASPGDLLGDASLLAEYDALFVNCGSDHSPSIHDGEYTDDELATARAWVEAGGTLYTSDQDYALFEGVDPDGVDFAEPTLDGPPETHVTATVLDRNIVALIGTAETDIYFDLPGWALMDAAVDATPLVTGEVEGVERPLAVMHWPGDGRTVFTSFHNNEQLTDAMQIILFELILAL